MFNFSMVPTYQMEYQFGWIGKADLKSYIEMGILDAAGYREIVGEEHEETSTQPLS